MNKDTLKIEIENIQAISKAAIEVEGFTGIVGRSNIGKSAFIRGLIAAFSNKAPKSIFREGTKESKVKIDDDKENIHIEWKRSGVTSLNEYVINGKVHSKVGKEPPEDISKWGFKPIKINDENLDIQFARQHLYLFLINQSGGFVADFISKITKADILTGAMKDCESDIRKNSDNIKYADKEIEKYSDDLKKFIDIDFFSQRAKDFIKDQEVIHSKKAEMQSLEKDIDKYDFFISEKNKLSNFPKIQDVVFDIFELQKISEWLAEISLLKNSYLKTKKIETAQLPDISFDLEAFTLIEQFFLLKQKINFNTPDLPDASIELSVVKEIEDYIQDLDQLFNLCEKLDGDLKEAKNKIQNYENDKISLEKKLGKCPLCSSNFNISCDSHKINMEAQL